MKKYIERKLIEEFGGRVTFTREDLEQFYLRYEPDLNRNTLGWRVYNLKAKNKIRSVGKCLYQVVTKPYFLPPVSQELIKLERFIQKHQPGTTHAIWDVEWINEFLHPQLRRKMVLIGVEKDLIHMVHHDLENLTSHKVYIKPDKKILEHHAINSRCLYGMHQLVYNVYRPHWYVGSVASGGVSGGVSGGASGGVNGEEDGRVGGIAAGRAGGRADGRVGGRVGGRTGTREGVAGGTGGGIGEGTRERKHVGSGYLAARHNPYWGHFLEKQGYCGVPRKKQKMDWRRREHIPEYAKMGKYPIVLTRLVTRSPIFKREGDGWQVISPTVEKILVDICIDSMFEFLRHDLAKIFERVFDSFYVDISTLLSYAKRRGSEQRIKPYIEQYLSA